MPEGPSQPALGNALRAERRQRRLSLRDLAAEIGVNFNTLSRVERGHIPDVQNYERILSWLGAPGQGLFDTPETSGDTTQIIARHLYTDERLTAENAKQILNLLSDMYQQLARPKPTVAVHLRSSQTFVPEAGALLSDLLTDMHKILSEEQEV